MSIPPCGAYATGNHTHEGVPLSSARRCVQSVRPRTESPTLSHVTQMPGASRCKHAADEQVKVSPMHRHPLLRRQYSRKRRKRSAVDALNETDREFMVGGTGIEPAESISREFTHFYKIL